jgi:hypothetical protein
LARRGLRLPARRDRLDGDMRPWRFAARTVLWRLNIRAGGPPGHGPGSGVHAGHLLTFSRASFARIRTTLAVIHLMFSTFVGTGVTELGAQPADVVRKFRSARHESRSHGTDLRTIPVERDAARHDFDVVFLQTCAGTMLAFGRPQYNFDTSRAYPPPSCVRLQLLVSGTVEAEARSAIGVLTY